MNIIAKLFTTPDGFERNRWGFARNQIGHMAIGAGLALVLPLWAALGIYAAWEAAQIAFQRAEPWDSIEDAAFAFAGALATLQPLIIVPASLHLAAGWLRRR